MHIYIPIHIIVLYDVTVGTAIAEPAPLQTNAANSTTCMVVIHIYVCMYS